MSDHGTYIFSIHIEEVTHHEYRRVIEKVAAHLLCSGVRSCSAILAAWRSGETRPSPGQSPGECASVRMSGPLGVHPGFQRRAAWWHQEALEARFRREANQAQALVYTRHALDASDHGALLWSHAAPGATAPRTLYSLVYDTNLFCGVLPPRRL